MPDPTDPGQPPWVSPESVPPRRAFLRGALGVGAAGAVGGAAAGYAYRATRPAPASQQALEHAQAGILPPVPFHGRYQAGILPQSQRQTAVISFNATADGRAELTELFRTITARATFLTAGGTPPPADIGAPPSDSGVLGPTVVPDGLTVTVGVGSTLFDDRYGLAAQQPARLKPMTAFPDDALDPAQCGGDLVLQLSAGNSDVVVYALRDIARQVRREQLARRQADRRRLLRRQLEQPQRDAAVLRAARRSGHPQPGDRRGRQELGQARPARAAATVPTVAAVPSPGTGLHWPVGSMNS